MLDRLCGWAGVTQALTFAALAVVASITPIDLPQASGEVNRQLARSTLRQSVCLGLFGNRFTRLYAEPVQTLQLHRLARVLARQCLVAAEELLVEHGERTVAN